MKNYIKLSILSLSVMGLASCDMDAPSISSLDASSVFGTYSLAEAEVMSIHVSFGETNSYRGRFLPYYGINTDVEWGNTPSYNDRLSDKQSLWNYNTLDANGQMNTTNNAYAKFYEGIERANLAIEGLRQYGNIESNRDMAQLLGEAHTFFHLFTVQFQFHQWSSHQSVTMVNVTIIHQHITNQFTTYST